VDGIGSGSSLPQAANAKPAARTKPFKERANTIVQCTMKA
jgi:hypothetical protein